MIASLCHLPGFHEPDGVSIKEAYPGDAELSMDFVRAQFSSTWWYEAQYALMQDPVKCFIAVTDEKVVGFACYDASSKGFFGPIGVDESLRGQGIGEALLLRTLHAMHAFGYGYAIIGWVGSAAPFYNRIVGAEWIKDAEPENSVYKRMVRF